MIKATIQNSPYCTEITFSCTETELSKKFGEIGMNPEHLAPMVTVLKIAPSGCPCLRTATSDLMRWTSWKENSSLPHCHEMKQISITT